MTRGQIVAWFQEAASMMGTVTNVEEQISKLKGALELAEATGDSNQVLGMTNQLHMLQGLRSKMEPALLHRTKTGDVEAARQFLTDMQMRLNQAEELYETWRRTQVRFELAVKLDEFEATGDAPTARAEAEKTIARAKHRYETALELASESIPSSVRLLHV